MSNGLNNYYLRKFPVVTLHNLPTTGSRMNTGMVVIIFCINIITYKKKYTHALRVVNLNNKYQLPSCPTAKVQLPKVEVQWTNCLASGWLVLFGQPEVIAAF